MKLRVLTIALAGTILAATYGAAGAADIDPITLRAVSAPNGKIELGGGWATMNQEGDSGDFYGGASLSLPLGDLIGMQADISVENVFNDTMYGGNLHLFTRDPNSYLLGVVAGGGASDNASLFYVGPEVELYMDNFSIEAWGGYLNLDTSGSSPRDSYFVQADLSYYATENLRLTVGGSSVADFNSGHAGFEYLLNEQQLPLALAGNVEIGEEGFAAVTGGIKIYLGGEGKSLIRRHREDDPRNRSLSIFSGIGNGLTPTPPGGPRCDNDPETQLPPCDG